MGDPLKIFLAVGALLVIAGCSGKPEQQAYRPLEATYQIGSESIVDPGPDDKKDRVYLYMAGDGAREIYEAMPARAEADVCDPTQLLKSAGDLACLKSKDGKVRCSVAVTLDRGRTANAWAC